MLDARMLARVYHRDDTVIDDINRSVVNAIVPALASVIKDEAAKISAVYSPDEVDPFSRDALQALLLSQVASFLSFDDLEQVEIIQPHQLSTAYAAFYFDVEIE